MLLSYKPLDLEAQQRLQEEGCVVDIRTRLSTDLINSTEVAHCTHTTEPMASRSHSVGPTSFRQNRLTAKPLWKERRGHLLQFPDHIATEKENSSKNLKKIKRKRKGQKSGCDTCLHRSRQISRRWLMSRVLSCQLSLPTCSILIHQSLSITGWVVSTGRV